MSPRKPRPSKSAKPAKLVVRRARAEDREAILAMSRGIWGGSDYLPLVWDRWLADDKGLLLTATLDGRPVGMWFEQGSQYQLFKEKQPTPHYQPDWNKINKRFRDTEFEIGASYTKGKSQIELKFETSGSKAALDKADEGLSNEYFYWVYSYKAL